LHVDVALVLHWFYWSSDIRYCTVPAPDNESVG